MRIDGKYRLLLMLLAASMVGTAFTPPELLVRGEPDGLGISPVETVTIYVSEDSTLSERYPNTNWGTGDFGVELGVGKYSDGYRDRAVLYFDLSSIPEGATIISAELKLRLKNLDLWGGSGSITVKAKRLPRGFTEACVTWVKRTCSENWIHEGGDHVNPTSYCTITDTSCLLATWDITEFVQGVVDGDYENYGLMLLSDDQGVADFYSREGASGAYCRGENKPHVVITYSINYDIELIQPSGGETIIADEIYQIKWTASPPGNYIYISFSYDGGSSWTKIDCVPNTGGTMTYYWHVPDIQSEHCLIRVSIASACFLFMDIYDTDTSGMFTITYPTTTPPPTTPPPTTTLPPTTTPPPTTTLPPTTTPPTTTPPPTTTTPPTTTPPPTSPAPSFDFSLSVTPSSLSVETGSTVSLVVSVDIVSGSSAPVRLSITGLPLDFMWSFEPDTLTPPASSSLKIKIGDRPGTYTFMVTGESDELSRSAAVTLVVEKPRRCIVATTAYGGELSEEVQTLRGFRDQVVMGSFLGGAFMRVFNGFYYSWSPWAARRIAENTLLRGYVRLSLYPLIYILRACQEASNLLAGLNAEAGVLLLGIASSMLVGAVYLGPTLLLTLEILNVRHGRKTLKTSALVFSGGFAFTALSLLAGSTPAAMISTSALVLSSIVLGAVLTSLITARA